MMEIHRPGRLPTGENTPFPTTSTGEVGEVGKQALNQHPHHHLSRGCGGVVGVAGGSILQVGKISALWACLQMQAGCWRAAAAYGLERR
jgi:hypothetical protein